MEAGSLLVLSIVLCRIIISETSNVITTNSFGVLLELLLTKIDKYFVALSFTISEKRGSCCFCVPRFYLFFLLAMNHTCYLISNHVAVCWKAGDNLFRLLLASVI